MITNEPVVHDEVLSLTDLIPNLDLSDVGLAQLRAGQDEFFSLMGAELSSTVERADHRVNADVVVRVHRPVSLTAPAACLYSIHGGGYVIGSYAMDDMPLDRYCNEFGCVGVSVEYRLSPETPYPGPLEDCYAGLAWTFAHAGELGIDPNRVGINGVSAGGGLAAALALLTRDRGEYRLAFQLLQCPMIDDRQVTPSSRHDNLLVWSRTSNTFGWQCYLGDLYGRDDVPAHAAAARADDLAGLPPAFVITGGADGFRDENIDYATRLAQAGVATDLTVIAGAPHGVQMFVGTTPERRWNRAVSEWLRPHLETTAQS
jgi:acetyl esterase/lipase